VILLNLIFNKINMNLNLRLLKRKI